MYELPPEISHLYKAKAQKCEMVDVPPFNYLMIDGQGDPATVPEYMQAMEALYSVSYTLKFMMKKETGLDFKVMALEGLWWADNMAEFSMDRRELWRWTSMIMQPPPVTAEWVSRAVDEVKRKKNPAALPLLRFETYAEGLAAQILHIGPYDAEPPTIQKLHASIHEMGYDFRGKHHEIYLGDPRRTAPEKLKTIIRQPVQK